MQYEFSKLLNISFRDSEELTPYEYKHIMRCAEEDYGEEKKAHEQANRNLKHWR